MKLGIFGGTFNPVHIGHLVIAQDALEQFELDRVIFMPSCLPPHKSTDNLVDAEHRFNMLRMAIEENPEFEVSRLEMSRGGTSFTIDTIEALQAKHPEDEVFFIIGSDSLPELHTWKQIEKLLGVCTFLTFSRPGYPANQMSDELLSLPKPWPETLKRSIINDHLIEISSSEIRMRIAEGLKISYFVPLEVEMYIAEHGLYRL